MISYSPAASVTVTLGDPAGGTVGRWLVRVYGTWTGSITPRKTVMDSAETTVANWPQVAYRNEAAQTDVDNATAITANGLYAIYADGCQVGLVYSRSSGTPTIECVPVRG